MIRFTFLFFSLLLGITQSAVAEDRSLVTELESEHVDVTIDFTGKNTLIFGAIAKHGDVVIKVRSPDLGVALSHKSKFGPFWLDSGRITVRGTPGLFYLLSSHPITEIVSPAEQKHYGLHLRDALSKAQLNVPATSEMADWQHALINLKERGLFRKIPNAVKVVKNRLFSAEIELPANIPLGIYHLDIYLVQNGSIISHKTQTLDVEEVKLEHWIATTVDGHSWLFGIGFTVFALILGLTIGMALRRI
jgi:uncharacterized protein (TIGR02186 family)